MPIKKIMIIAAIGLSTVAAFQNCSDVQFSTVATVVDACSADPMDSCHATTEAIQKIQPAVAVRGITCLMCHAQIKSNVITDFGFGTPYFFGQDADGINSASWYNNYVNTWQSATITNGQVFVPKQNMPLKIQKSVAEFSNKPAMSIKNFMTTPYRAPDNWSENTAQMGQVEMAFNVRPTAGEKVVEKSSIVISAPTESEILAIVPEFANSPNTAFKRMNSDKITQLSVVTRTDGSFVQNDQNFELDCDQANIVVKGTLLLKNLKLSAVGGCKIYVTGTVFIQGAITYNPTKNGQNLQITSANGIFMGINYNNMTNRLLSDHRGLQIEGNKTYTERADQAVKESSVIGDLKDATENPGGQSINFSGLLLNAPLVHSRYLGEFNGVIIAQAALFRLGQFHFQFDPVFMQTNVLPLLKRPILVVAD